MSGGFSDALGQDNRSVSDDDLKQLEELFRSIADNIAMARQLMFGMGEKDTRGSILSQVRRENGILDSSQLSLAEDKADVENALVALFDGIHPVDFDDHLRQYLIDYFRIDGWVAAGVLACLLRHPGQHISHDRLAKMAGVQSSSSRVIRVYVCQIRSSLEGKGLSGDGIETGRGSYRIVRSAAFGILNAIARN